MQSNGPDQFDQSGYFEEAAFEGQEPPFGLSNWLGTDAPWNPINSYSQSTSQPPAPPQHPQNPISTRQSLPGPAFHSWRSQGLPSDCETVPGDSGYGSFLPSNFDNASNQGDDRVQNSIPDVEHVLGGFHLTAADAQGPGAPLNLDHNGVDAAATSSQASTVQTCPDCNLPVRTKSEMNKHLQRHKKPHLCTYPDCSRSANGFASNNDLVRHKRTVHGEMQNGRTFICRHDACAKKDKYWPRADNFRSHLLRVHKLKIKAEDDLGDYVYQSNQQSQDLEGVGTKLHESGPLEDQSMEPGQAPRIQSISEFPEISTPAPSTSHIQAASTVYNYGYLMPTSPTVDRSRPRVPQRDFAVATYENREAPKLNGQWPMSSAPGKSLGHDLPPVQSVAIQVDSKMEDMDDAASQSASAVDQSADASTTSDNESDDDSKTSFESFADVVRHSSQLAPDKLKDLSTIESTQLLGYLKILPKAMLQKALESQEPDTPTQSSVSSAKAKIECTTCAKKFNRPCELRKHNKRHEKPYGCTWHFCDKTFGSKNDWKRHETNQHGQIEIWRCNYNCEAVFSRRENFQAHLEKKHKITDSPLLERTLEENRRGSHCTDSFWCGFCKKFVPVERGANVAAHERFDHIDDHFMGRHGFPVQRVAEWTSMEELADVRDDLEAKQNHPTDSADSESGKKRKRNVQTDSRPAKLAHRS